MTYKNKRMEIVLSRDKEIHEVTINLKDVYIDDGKVFLDPTCKKNSLLRALKKYRIIKDICGTLNYNYVDIPIATINMGYLREFDYDGVSRYINLITKRNQ